jgi:hypothetical protein
MLLRARSQAEPVVGAAYPTGIQVSNGAALLALSLAFHDTLPLMSCLQSRGRRIRQFETVQYRNVPSYAGKHRHLRGIFPVARIREAISSAFTISPALRASMAALFS